MSYAVKYRSEFYATHGDFWRIDILEDSWTGSIFDLKATGDPLHFEFDSDSDLFNEPIRPSKAKFNVWAIANFQLTDLYSEQDFKHQVIVYKNTEIFWIGYIITGEYTEPYDCPPYRVSITAIDGLNYLKQILYAETDRIYLGTEEITYYEGHQVESKIIFDILNKIWITSFREYINIFETNMDSSIDDSPLQQTEIDVDVFRDMMCWDVLTEILKKYNAVIRQSGGEMCIYRPTELMLSTVFGREFTSWNVKTSISYIPDQYIKRHDNNTSLNQFPGSILMVKRAVKKITINQDYGYKKSWIDNWEIKGNTFTGNLLAGFTLQSWTQSVPHLAVPLTYIGETDGVFLAIQNHYPTLNKYLYQTFGLNAVASSDVFMIEFDYLIYNYSTTPVTSDEDFYIRVKSEATGHYLYAYNDDHCLWDASLNTIILSQPAPIGTTGWVTFSRSVVGIPDAGPYTITFFALNDAFAQVFVAVKNVRFYSTSDALVMKFERQTLKGVILGKKFIDLPHLEIQDNTEIVAKHYTLANAVRGIDMNMDYLLGDVIDTNIDNVIEQFQGVLTLAGSPLVKTAEWNTLTPVGEAKPILELIGDEIGHQHSRPKQLVQMNIKEYTATVYSGGGDSGSVTADTTLVTADDTTVTVDSE
jgi:hypothetical protein